MRTLFVFVFLLPQLLFGQEIPSYYSQFSPTGRVNDYGYLLNKDQKRQLTHLTDSLSGLGDLEFGVCTVTSLDGHAIDNFARELSHRWQWPEQSQGHTILILIAPKENEFFFAIGKEVTPLLSEEFIVQLSDETILPLFEQGAYHAGITEAVSALHAQSIPTARKPPILPLLLILAIFVYGYRMIKKTSSYKGPNRMTGRYFPGSSSHPTGESSGFHEKF